MDTRSYVLSGVDRDGSCSATGTMGSHPFHAAVSVKALVHSDLDFHPLS